MPILAKNATLARLLASRGYHAEALRVLAPIHEWFTEGHGTAEDVGHELRVKDFVDLKTLR